MTSAVLAALLAVPVVQSTTAAADDTGTGGDDPTDARADERLTLVALQGPGTASPTGRAGTPAERAALLAQQDAVLRTVEADGATYRWTTALNGFALPLTDDQAAQLARDPRVAAVEPSQVVPMAARLGAAAPLSKTQGPARGGAGVVVGVVDSGIDPDSPVFAAVPGLGRDPRSWAGACAAGEDWAPDTCNRKLVGARWFVAGFGTDRVRSSESLSARDDLGHGTQVASVAAGNSGVSVRVAGRDAGQFNGMAPQARVAAYKACWAAPDPQDDGCATADLVAAVDAAVADGVDVLNLAVGSGGAAAGVDMVDRALLGAAEADVVVIGAAGNSARAAYAAHPAPWVTTVGAATGGADQGTLVLPDGTRLVGGGRPTRVSGRLVHGVDARADGAAPKHARQCRPGSLDAATVKGRVVVCARGGVGRVDKSIAVDRADGVGMVLVNTRRGGFTADFHSVPTVHLTLADARTLRRATAERPRMRVRLVPGPEAGGTMRVAAWSPEGDPRSPIVKPDLVAPGSGVLGATPESTGDSWAAFSGTSAASAQVAGLAARLRARTGWSAAVIRSVLSTTATPARGVSVLSQGAGILPDGVPATHLALEVSARRWRKALDDGSWDRLNTSSLVARPGTTQVSRRITNLGRRAEYFSVSAEGFADHDVTVTPAAVRLAPGESARFRIAIDGPAQRRRLDDGYVVWRGARGGLTRIPVALTR